MITVSYIQSAIKSHTVTFMTNYIFDMIVVTLLVKLAYLLDNIFYGKVQIVNISYLYWLE